MKSVINQGSSWHFLLPFLHDVYICLVVWKSKQRICTDKKKKSIWLDYSTVNHIQVVHISYNTYIDKYTVSIQIRCLCKFHSVTELTYIYLMLVMTLLLRRRRYIWSSRASSRFRRGLGGVEVLYDLWPPIDLNKRNTAYYFPLIYRN